MNFYLIKKSNNVSTIDLCTKKYQYSSSYGAGTTLSDDDRNITIIKKEEMRLDSSYEFLAKYLL
ncbi:hypothetical protein [Clostridioides sp. ZZV15-6598]|uniref:hypothetical protein n=1 Tax=Clostridioides sp. ZZV15-6598 TaxID=2811501 RepID=UPI001D130774|nr:hypothetical protein [Clostridioides sp. ZZV15-6598]